VTRLSLTRLLPGSCCIALAAVLCSGCGGPSAAARAQARAADFALLAPELKDRLSTQAAAVKTACENQAGAFLNSISDLDSRLDVGLSFDEYSSAVGDANVEHDRVVPSSLHGNCLSAAAADESALNFYINAENTWSDCFSNDYCTTDQIEPQLQKQWAKASTKDEEAKADLARIAGGASLALGSHEFPRTSYAVDNTIYGTIVKTVCTGSPDPPAAAGPCAGLKNVLAGGVSSSEENKIDSAVNDLVKALGLKTD
jgi:hypothetical protein